MSLETIIQYQFKDKNLLKTALTHPSYLQSYPTTQQQSYQRLEFLGDAVLSLVISEKLYSIYKNAPEGLLARFRAILIRGKYLVKLAKKINLHKFIRLSEVEKNSGGALKDSILENAFEALTGAVFLDSNYSTTRSYLLKLYGNIKDEIDKCLQDENPKGKLQEIFHSYSSTDKPTYHLTKEEGPDHSKLYHVELKISGKNLSSGFGPSLKSAEEMAAKKALSTLKVKKNL